MNVLRTAHTADLDPAELAAARRLLDDAFDGDFSDADWAHGLGGVHALVHDDATGALLAHGSVAQRRAVHRGRTLRVGYVEAVAVRADVRRTGLGGQLMGALERVIERAHDLGALSASADGEPLYTGRGWVRWAGPFAAYGPDGVVALPDEDPPLLFPPAAARALDPGHPLLFDWRDGDLL
ncbi:GNAT family N-acetyltransferase [Streptomyces sp. VRA16 Mangrove soil]|uniref:GNAT family N-acetyltransferase n=1 Tax=Streptomyces sp. VRA16 Mangrove soil TaxID=2817434 RepID=UPI001A9F1734|nr:GNAT family N-acetyltransferase [Streptomyces sp. VRA16 Mangrove soil]MBO1336330.1 GNAT family N-acetyltransferase [Streptomyces sp. VRA16 Mangrove soil]